jgi:hypothetical protein
MTNAAEVPAESYTCGSSPVLGRGLQYVDAAFDDTFNSALRAIHRDEAGIAEIRTLLLDGIGTHFETSAVDAILNESVPEDDWRIGETIAVAYLQTHQNYVFPWPASRDARNRDGSLPGADNVGFRRCEDGVTRFAFGETKTSAQTSRPPSVLNGRMGLVQQLIERLPDKKGSASLIRYLAYRSASSSAMKAMFRSALDAHMSEGGHAELVGVMVRPLEPHENDLKPRCISLARTWKGRRDLELFALYVPSDIFSRLRHAWTS